MASTFALVGLGMMSNVCRVATGFGLPYIFREVLPQLNLGR